MIAFARAKAKTIFSKLRLSGISKTQSKMHAKAPKQKLSIQLEKTSDNFLEATKKGGIWLS